jgi:hypothetical protein
MNDSLLETALAEVSAHHSHLADWFRDPDNASAESETRSGEVLAEDFSLVRPNGQIMTRNSLLARLRAAGGCFSSCTSFDLRVEKPVAKALGTDHCLVTYEVWRERDGVADGRVLSVILGKRPGLPSGLEWVHVQETWIEGHEGELLKF